MPPRPTRPTARGYSEPCPAPRRPRATAAPVAPGDPAGTGPHRRLAPDARTTVVLSGRGAPALAHRVLVAPTVTDSEPEALFSTSLGTTGPRVVFLHGLFGQGRNWTTVAKALADQARVLLVDLPNHGRSAWTETFSYPDMAAQEARLLRRTGDGEAYAVVGHSMGGKVAMALALHHPELVARLAVVDVSPAATAEVSHFARYVDGMRSLDLATLTDRTQADGHLARYVSDPGIRSFLLQNLRREPEGDGGWRWQMNLA